MKGNNKAKAKAKKGKGKGGFNGSKRSRREHLHSFNHQLNAARRVRTKLKRVAFGPPGSPQGKHIDKNPDCRCGGCSSKVPVNES